MPNQSETYENLLQEIEQLKKRVAELEHTEQKNLSLANDLNTCKEILQKTFMAVPAPMGMILNRTLEEVNPMICELTGYSRDELIGRNSRIFYRSDQEYNWVGEEKYSQIDKYGIGTVETIWRHKDGLLIDILLSSLPIDKKDYSKGFIFTANDISSQKRLKNEQISSEERLKIIFENAPDAIYLNDLKGYFIDGNRAVEKLVGYKREELIGKSFFNLDLMTGKNLIKATQMLARNVIGQKTEPDIITIHHKSGKKIKVEISTFPVTINKERLVLGIARNITKRLEEKKKLRESERNRIFHIQQSPLAIIEWDLEFNVRQWNQAAEEIFGYTAEEALGRYCNFILPKKQEDKIEGIWDTILETKNSTNSINKNQRKNGDIILCEWHNTPLFDEKNNIVAIASFAQDITERAKSEELRSVLYNISNAANTAQSLNTLIKQIRDELTTVIDTTNFFVALYDQETESFSLPFFSDEKDSFTSFPAGKTITSIVINSKKPLLCNKQELDERKRNGEIDVVGSMPEIWLGVPLQLEDKVIGALVLQSYNDQNAYSDSDLQILQFVSNQISLTIQRKNTEEKMAQALQSATEADRLKSAFLANMSHEIRTPMNGILGFTSLLKNEKINEEERLDYLSIIEKSGKRMLGVINDLIDISKVESGITEVILSNFNLTDVFNYTFSFFKPEAEAKGLELSCSPGLLREEAFIKSDKEKVYAIITNLVKNAIKYTKSGQVHFGYEVYNELIKFTVTDTGIGIPEENIDSIFNRFVQAGSLPTNNLEGVGLGLAITKAYIHLLNGKIWVESTQMKGSAFYVEIPYSKGINIKNTEKMDTVEKGNKQKNKLKVLVAEDDAINRKLFSYHLKDVVDELILVTNGTEAVKTYTETPDINLILMDLKMPEMDGYEATRLIREKNSEVIIIALSAFAFETEKNKAKQNGFNDYVPKPVSKVNLLKAIGNYFEV